MSGVAATKMTMDVGTLEDFYVCTMLDPRFKGFTQWLDDRYGLAWALKVLRASWRANFKGEVEIVDAPALTPLAPAAAPVKKRGSFSVSNFAHGGEVCGGAGAGAGPSQPVAPVPDELEEYLREPPLITADAEADADFNVKGIFDYWLAKVGQCNVPVEPGLSG